MALLYDDSGRRAFAFLAILAFFAFFGIGWVGGIVVHAAVGSAEGVVSGARVSFKK
jgi:hypothetical protein